MTRTLPIALLTSTMLLTACGTQYDPSAHPLMTEGGHVLDQRAWAAGSEIRLSPMVRGPLHGSVDFENSDGTSSDVVSIHNEDGYSTAGMVVKPGSFDAVAKGPLGKELQRVPLRAEEPVDYKLGVLLDDCPEFADMLFEDRPAFVSGSNVLVAPAPVDASGRQLLGHFPYQTSSPSLLVEDNYWMGQPVQIDFSGSLDFEIEGTVHSFAVDAIPRGELVSIEIAAIPEKHGMADASLLCALGRTADGRVVHGIQADWGDGWTSQTTHAGNGSEVEACFGGMCAQWRGPEAL